MTIVIVYSGDMVESFLFFVLCLHVICKKRIVVGVSHCVLLEYGKLQMKKSFTLI